MKSMLIAALVVTQATVAAQPTMAAGFGDENGALAQRHGVFAGARLRVPLGGASGRKASAGLAVAPVALGRQADGRVQTRFGEGLTYGAAGGEGAKLSFAGRPVAQLGQGPDAPDGRRAGVSTAKGLLIAGGVIVVVLGAVAIMIAAQ